MTANDVWKLVAQITRDFLNPDILRIVLLLLVAWAVLLLAQIRRLLTRLVEDGSVRSSFQRDAPPSLDDLISRRR
jgi:hypothetical protein